ncbi:MAG: hypothetical protein QOH96_3299 [Blastocatellia bacterium]|nr:hypothetical protein [Blastocatellia bacterium]
MTNRTMHKAVASADVADQQRVSAYSAPSGWHEAQKSIAAGTGLSILLVHGEQPPEIDISNNNSICASFQASDSHRHLCRPFCGKAYDKSNEKNGPFHFQCHAGIHCVVIPIQIVKGRRDAVIGGRAFLKSSDYRAVAERMREGDLQDILSPQAFSNVIFASNQDLEDLSVKISREEKRFQAAASASKKLTTEASVEPAAQKDAVSLYAQSLERHSTDVSGSTTVDFVLERSEVKAVAEPSLQTLGLTTASFAFRHGFESVALVILDETHAVTAFANGKFSVSQFEFQLAGIDVAVRDRLLQGTAISLTEEQSRFLFAPDYSHTESDEQIQGAALFPLVFGGDLRGLLMIADTAFTADTVQLLEDFAQNLATSLESIGLRNELRERAEFARAAHVFSLKVNVVEPSETYRAILRQSAEMLGAERGSLLLLDHSSNELTVKAAVGMRENVAKVARIKMGEGISGSVLRDGRALMVRNADSFGIGHAHIERNYKSKSFISYPIEIGGKKVGVLNITDRKDGESFNQYHLNLLETIGPQMALALDRAEWQEKAAQFQLMSITDPLTGLLNRRYLEERLTEELNRSKRNLTPMSFVMIDIDDFKRYNDTNGHQAGDDALELTAQCLKSVLRSEDVAARYGGEEFSILLPQTNIDEAHFIAQRLREKILNTDYVHGRAQPLGAVTVSIGVSSFTKLLDNPVAIIGAADRALYVAKGAGKNRVHLDEESYRDYLGTNATGPAKQNKN